MNVEVVNIEAGTDALETLQAADRIESVVDLGTIILHLMPNGFIAFMVDGRCVVAGEAVEMLG